MLPNRLCKGITCSLLLFTNFLIAFENETDQQRILREERAAYDQYIGYISQIEDSFCDQMEQEYNLRFGGSSGTYHEKVKYISLSLIANRRATIEEARTLLIQVIEKLMIAVNTHVKIQPYLDEFPFSKNRVQVVIRFEGINGPYADGTVVNVHNMPKYEKSFERNHVYYRADDPFTKLYIPILDESFEEAVQRLEATPVKNPAIHDVTEADKKREEAIDQLIESYRTEMYQKYSLEYWSLGGKMVHDIEEIGGLFVLVGRTTQEKAREIIVKASQRLLELVNANETLRPYLKEYPFPAKRLKLRINFRDKRYFPYYTDSMESVTLVNNEVNYYQEPSIDEPIDREPYQESLQLLKNPPKAKKEKQPISYKRQHLKAWFRGFWSYLYNITGLEVALHLLSRLPEERSDDE